MISIWGAVLRAVSIILPIIGSTMLVHLYAHCAPAEVGALTSIFGAIFFTLMLAARQRGRAPPKSRGKLRAHWIMVATMILVSLPESQLTQIALNGVGVGALTAITTAGLLAITTWRLVFDNGRVRPRHIIWLVIAIAGVILLVRPFHGHGASAGGMAAAVILSASGIVTLVIAVRLTKEDLLPQTIAMLRWASACVVGFPILALGDQRWMTAQVLVITAACAMLAVFSNWTAVAANRLARSDGLIASVDALSPVFAVLIGLIAGEEAPGPWEWIGAGLIVTASTITVWILDRRKRAPAEKQK